MAAHSNLLIDELDSWIIRELARGKLGLSRASRRPKLDFRDVVAVDSCTRAFLPN